MLHKFLLSVLAVLFGCATSLPAANIWNLKSGSPGLKSAGHLAFGPDGILFVGDTKSAAIFAIATGDTEGNAQQAAVNVKNVDKAIATALGIEAANVEVIDLAANPMSGNVYATVQQGDQPTLVRIDVAGNVAQVPLDEVEFSKVVLPNAPEDRVVGEGPRARNRRAESITDLAFVQGKVIVAGLSTGDSPSTVREIVFPFAEADTGTRLEIYHGNHGRYEDTAAIRALVPFNIGGEPSLLAGFVCTPLVKFPISELSKEKIQGTTVAELGNRNQPLDMIVYQKGGKDFLLMANSARGVMKISTENLADAKGITAPVGGTAGQPYETIEGLKGVVQLDRLNDTHAVILVKTDDGAQHLQTVELP